MNISCLIIDDEPLAIGLLESFVRQTNFLSLKKTFSNAVEALTYLNQEAVDLVFLDIQMPELSGMELARLLDAKPTGQKPKIIFTTAYNEFAVEGYKVEAIDYLLKPFSYEEFHRAAGKVYQYFEEREAAAAQAKGAAAVPASPDYIFLKVEYQVLKVNKSSITHIEAYKDYVKVHLKEKAAQYCP
ncbi:LytR/AlgR family response regulator transcription factor [Nitritalea halalkaliphila]|uniref:LytR/AlgR family response regulator transcription factor n=1 Tax=Nitritalea halalkaliphila TaxID=590849 RepID=UPI0002E99C88|nr:response regulator [Nitritalea halalkaliphila]